MAPIKVTLPARPLLGARSACEQDPHASFHKPWANLQLLLGSSGRDRKYLSPGGAETAALQRCRRCRGICCDCLRRCGHFAGTCREPSCVQKAWEIQPANLVLLVLRCREWNLLSRECTQGLFITHPTMHQRSHPTNTHIWDREAVQGSKASLNTSATNTWLHAARRYRFSQSSKHFFQTSFRMKKKKKHSVKNAVDNTEITGTVTTQPVPWNRRAPLLSHPGSKQPWLCTVFYGGWLLQNPKIP